MTPNLFVVARKACSPHRWFHDNGEKVRLGREEIWRSPVPGIYRHRPGLGWALVAAQDSKELLALEQPIPVIYAQALHRYVFEEEFFERLQSGFSKDNPRQKEPVAFFRMDDEATYIQCYDNKGNFIPGPYQRYVFDERIEKFRHMLKRDNPEWSSSRVPFEHGSSAASSLHTSMSNSACPSRRSSFENQRSSVPHINPSPRHESVQFAPLCRTSC